MNWTTKSHNRFDLYYEGIVGSVWPTLDNTWVAQIAYCGVTEHVSLDAAKNALEKRAKIRHEVQTGQRVPKEGRPFKKMVNK